MYAEPADGKSNLVVFGSEALTTFASDIGAGPIRAMFDLGGEMYAVSDNGVYLITSYGSSTLVDTVSGSVVDWASNGTYVCLVTGVGNNGYLFDGSTATVISDPDFGGADTVDSLDGYFIFSDGTGSFFINETPFNGANYDALDFASAESNPDNILKVFVDHREVFLFGERTIESWYNSGDVDFPIERTPGAIIEKGLAGTAVSQLDNSVIWLDDNGVARRLQDGYGSQRISTHSVESDLGSLVGAKSFSYTHKGHEFYALHTGNGTFVYDAATKLWHERKTWNKPRWRADNHLRMFGKNLVGDFESGTIYELSDTAYADGSDLLVSEMIFPPISMDGRKFKLSSLQLDLEQGSAGDVRLWLSNDGEVWRSAGTRSLGAVGDRDARTIWRGLGQHRNLHLKFAFSDSVRRAVFSAYANIT